MTTIKGGLLSRAHNIYKGESIKLHSNTLWQVHCMFPENNQHFPLITKPVNT